MEENNKDKNKIILGIVGLAIILILLIAGFLYKDKLIPPAPVAKQDIQPKETPKKEEQKATGVPNIKFLGAAQMVGGSCFLIDTGKTKFLVDVGLFYGSDEQHLNKKLDFDPKQIDFVLLTHSHMDHAGRIPLLYKEGYTGKVYGTDASKSILGVMLEMSIKMAEGLGQSLFGFDEFKKTMENFETIPYYEKKQLSEDVSVKLYDAGHILGSATLQIFIKDEKGEFTLVVASDFGAKRTPLLKDPDILTEGDYILIESTYGANKKKKSNFTEFGKSIAETINNGGSVLVPAFVLEKTQKVIYIIGELKRQGVIPKDVPVYSDSSTAKDVTKIYRKYYMYYDEESSKLFKENGDALYCEGLQELKSKETLKTHDTGKPAIYISSSGMLDHGAAPRHLEKMIENPKNLIAIVGWQAPSSLGRKLQEGAKTVSIPIEEFSGGKVDKKIINKPVKMQVKKFGNFSSHADGCEIMDWLSNFKKTKKIFVIHGDKENVFGLAKAVNEKLGFNTATPVMNETVSLSAKEKDYPLNAKKPFCEGDEIDKFNSKADQ